MNDTSKIHDADSNKNDALFCGDELNPFDTKSDEPSSFGHVLREYREESGYTVERAAVATRISYPFIEALEESDLSKLPATVFGRGFIRNLCKVYGREPDTILDLFECALEGGDSLNPSIADGVTLTDVRAKRLLKSNVKIKEQLRPFFRKISLRSAYQVTAVVSLVAVGTLASAGYYYYYQSKSVSNKPNALATQASTVPAAAPVQGAAQKAAVSASQSDAAVADADLSKKIAPETKAVSEVKISPLVAEVSVATKIEIDRYDGKGFQMVSFDPGSHTIAFDRKVTLVLKDVNAIELTYLGKPLGDLSARGKSRRITLGSLE
jgi:cytoskeletal protein RodZ